MNTAGKIAIAAGVLVVVTGGGYLIYKLVTDNAKKKAKDKLAADAKAAAAAGNVSTIPYTPAGTTTKKDNLSNVITDVSALIDGIGSNYKVESYPLASGMKGTNVKRLQKALKKMGYNVGISGANGNYNPATKKALNQFWKDRKYSGEPIIDEIWLEKIEKMVAQ